MNSFQIHVSQLPIAAFPLMVMGINGGYVFSNFSEQKFCCCYSKKYGFALLPFPPHQHFCCFKLTGKLHKGPPPTPFT